MNELLRGGSENENIRTTRCWPMCYSPWFVPTGGLVGILGDQIISSSPRPTHPGVAAFEETATPEA